MCIKKKKKKIKFLDLYVNLCEHHVSDFYVEKKETPVDSEPCSSYSSGENNVRFSRELEITDEMLQSLVENMAKNLDVTFSDKLQQYIIDKDLKNTDVYKAAQIDRRLFSKIISDRNYRPSKDTCISLCIGLNLSLEEANDMIQRAGYILSHSDKRDLIIEWCFAFHLSDIDDVNAVLSEMGQKILGK